MGRNGLIWLVMGVDDSRDGFLVDVIVLDGTLGGRASYHGRHFWRLASVDDPAYVFASELSGVTR